MRTVLLTLMILCPLVMHFATATASSSPAPAATVTAPADDADDAEAMGLLCTLRCRDQLVQCAELCQQAGEPPSGYCTCSCENTFCGCMASCGVRACVPKLCRVQ